MRLGPDNIQAVAAAPPPPIGVSRYELPFSWGSMGVRPSDSIYVTHWSATDLALAVAIPAVALAVVGLCGLGRRPATRRFGDIALGLVSLFVALVLARDPVEDVASPLNLAQPAFDARGAVFKALAALLVVLTAAVVAGWRRGAGGEAMRPPWSWRRQFLLTGVYAAIALLVAEAVVGYAGSAWLLTASAWWPLVLTVAVLAAGLSLRIAPLSAALPLAPRPRTAPARRP